MEFSPQTATTVMLVSKGYPEKYEKEKLIDGLENFTNSLIFHAGTKIENGKVLTNGGRVLAVTSFGETMTDALAKSYTTIDKIRFDGKTFRKDIGQDLKQYAKA